jgi:hypothetical protein
MRLYEPKIEVRLVKAFPRKDIVPDVPVATRYESPYMRSFLLTDYLGDAGAVRTSKSIRQPAGGFSITFADKVNSDFYDTIYAMIEPMDMVEMRFCHDPNEYAKPLEGYRPPIVMRGLVSNVTRSETMTGGKPVRTVTVSGQDYGKILQIFQIFYLNNSVVGDNLLTEFQWFQKYAKDGAPKLQFANEFVDSVLSKVVNPYLERFSSRSDGAKVDAAVIKNWTAKTSVDGVISPWLINQFNNVSLYQMMAKLLDIGPFNELYVEDSEDGVVLNARPAPFLDAMGNPIQGVRPEKIKIDSEDVVSMSVNRTDAGTANYFWVSASQWSMYNNETQKMLASVGKESSFIKFDYLNSNMAYYGIRKMEVETALLPNDYIPSDSDKSAQSKSNSVKSGNWIENRRDLLAEINKDNVIFENGSMRLRGNERVKAGMQLELTRGGGNVKSSAYVTQVDHEYIPYQGFFTNVIFERGTGFINRSQQKTPVYFDEIDGWGAQ